MRKVAMLAILSAGMLAQTPAPTQREQPTVALPADFAQVLTDYQSAWSKKDSVALAKLFVENGFVLSPGHPMVRSRESIERFYRGQGGPLFLRAVAFDTNGGIAYIIGAFARRSNEPDLGKFTLTLNKTPSGRWLIFSDMDNGNVPGR